MSNQLVLLGGCACCLCIIFTVVMLATSITVVETTEWCLKYDWWAESVDEDPISTPGMQFVFMGNYLIRYPNVNKNVYFRKSNSLSIDAGDIRKGALAVRTNDGLTVDLELEFTYKLQLQNLRKLYLLVGEHMWYESLIYTSEGVIDNVATEYTAQEFFLNRTQIEAELTNRLREALDTNLFITLQTLQLQPAHFPAKYSASITETQTWSQDIEVAQQEQLTAIIKKNTELKTAQELAQKVVVQAQASAQEVLLNNNATVTQFKYRQLKEAQGYQQTLAFFAQENEAEAVGNLLLYMKTRAFAEHDEAKKTIKLATR